MLIAVIDLVHCGVYCLVTASFLRSVFLNHNLRLCSCSGISSAIDLRPLARRLALSVDGMLRENFY